MFRATILPRGALWALAALACAVSLGLARAAVAAEAIILTGKVVTTVTRAVPVPFNSVVDEVLVRPGDAVEDGSPLLRYHLQDEAERILQREVTSGAGTEGLKGQVLDMERQLAQLVAERNKSRQLVASGLGSKQALSRQESSVSALRDRIELTQSTIRKTESNFAARLRELSGYFGQPIREGEELPRTLVLTSPIRGYVLSLASNLNPGNLMAANSAPVQVGQLNPVLIQVPVYEADVNTIKVGDKAQVEIPSLGDRKFTGLVSEISWLSTDMNVANPSYYTVELTVANPDLVLKPGFKAVVRFDGGGQAAGK
ncbi:MAG: HlyD family efflux transporter periplasmic adaptor subunit [Desulfovibrio sp.]|uniref:efflux RND transporter periplasmic adaptor subunit n=1 Tax=Desulfovibrio sp. TaxID=885 RepID=UPI001A75A373|nr:efflux RND transporter periplasmic adaptor subunit [Desulfovibrio sp.]MBD5417896.1 HlyD family efflux transporter periplasmic adaptor subunit [Desulfovibrio sp.]